jgi:hypothetical protein
MSTIKKMKRALALNHTRRTARRYAWRSVRWNYQLPTSTGSAACETASVLYNSRDNPYQQAPRDWGPPPPELLFAEARRPSCSSSSSPMAAAAACTIRLFVAQILQWYTLLSKMLQWGLRKSLLRYFPRCCNGAKKIFAENYTLHWAFPKRTFVEFDICEKNSMTRE